MIDKSEIGRNIRELLEGYIEKGKRLEVTLRLPDYADVFVEGKYFNTYCIKTKNFLSNIHAEKTESNDFYIPVRIEREDLTGKYRGYKGAELMLPASVYEIKDGFQRARITDEPYCISECGLYGDDISEKAKGYTDALEKLNNLANALKKLTQHEHALYRGYIKQKGLDSLTLNELINIVYNLHDCDIIYGVFNDTDLGKLYSQNGMLDWVCNIGEDVWQYLDYESIGKDIREGENGIYTEDGYFSNGSKEYTLVYDGLHFPEPFENDEYIFKLLISPKTETSDAKKEGEWLSLPVSDEGAEAFFDRIGAAAEDCILYAVLSMETEIPMLVKGMHQFDTLNLLARKMKDLDQSGKAAKFKAVVASGICNSLEEVTEMADRLDGFEFYPELSTPVEFAMGIYKDKYAPVLPESFERYFDFASYAEELSTQGNIFVTEYGVIYSTFDGILKTENTPQ